MYIYLSITTLSVCRSKTQTNGEKIQRSAKFGTAPRRHREIQRVTDILMTRYRINRVRRSGVFYCGIGPTRVEKRACLRRSERNYTDVPREKERWL